MATNAAGAGPAPTTGSKPVTVGQNSAPTAAAAARVGVPIAKTGTITASLRAQNLVVPPAPPKGEPPSKRPKGPGPAPVPLRPTAGAGATDLGATGAGAGAQNAGGYGCLVINTITSAGSSEYSPPGTNILESKYRSHIVVGKTVPVPPGAVVNILGGTGGLYAQGFSRGEDMVYYVMQAGQLSAEGGGLLQLTEPYVCEMLDALGLRASSFWGRITLSKTVALPFHQDGPKEDKPTDEADSRVPLLSCALMRLPLDGVSSTYLLFKDRDGKEYYLELLPNTLYVLSSRALGVVGTLSHSVPASDKKFMTFMVDVFPAKGSTTAGILESMAAAAAAAAARPTPPPPPPSARYELKEPIRIPLAGPSSLSMRAAARGAKGGFVRAVLRGMQVAELMGYSDEEYGAELRANGGRGYSMLAAHVHAAQYGFGGPEGHCTLLNEYAARPDYFGRLDMCPRCSWVFDISLLSSGRLSVTIDKRSRGTFSPTTKPQYHVRYQCHRCSDEQSNVRKAHPAYAHATDFPNKAGAAPACLYRIAHCIIRHQSWECRTPNNARMTIPSTHHQRCIRHSPPSCVRPRGIPPRGCFPHASSPPRTFACDGPRGCDTHTRTGTHCARTCPVTPSSARQRPLACARWRTCAA